MNIREFPHVVSADKSREIIVVGFAQAQVGRLQSQAGRLSHEVEALRRQSAGSCSVRATGAALAPAGRIIAAGGTDSHSPSAQSYAAGDTADDAAWFRLLHRAPITGARVADFAPNMGCAVVSCECDAGGHSITLINILTRSAAAAFARLHPALVSDRTAPLTG